MGENYTMKYSVDMVFCIDATGSMQPVIDTVKMNALNFYQDVMKNMELKSKHIDKMRVRVIAFRDYIADGKQAMLATNFFNLPEQATEFEKCVNSIKADGGGDEPEDGLEALAYAIKSDWTKDTNKQRNIVVVWSDASTHEVGFGKKSPYYPKGMPQTFSELTSWWGDEQTQTFIKNAAKRLVMFTPEVPYWKQVSETWNNVIHYPSDAGNGLQEVSYNDIIHAICNSI